MNTTTPTGTRAAPPTNAPAPIELLGGRRLVFGSRTLIMGIVNVTEDSFTDDGLLAAGGEAVAERAARRALALHRDGAHIVDIGGESSEARDHHPIPPDEEIRRVVPVVERLRARAPGLIISVDTWKSSVARAAAAAGADIINDVGAAQRDPDMARAAAETGAAIVVMHDQVEPTYRDIMADLAAFFEARIGALVQAGVRRERIILDAGFGFAKDVAHDLEMTRRLGELRRFGLPILHAPSRKRTIGRVLGFPDSIPERLMGTAAACAIGIAQGADILRVHDVLEMARLARMTDAIVRRWPPISPAAPSGA